MDKVTILLLFCMVFFSTCFGIDDKTLYFIPEKQEAELNSINFNNQPNGSQCTVDMFHGDKYSYWACITQYALQENWFPSPLAGLVTYLNWNGMDGFWQDGSVLETMANFMYYGNHTRYKSVLEASLKKLGPLLHAYHPQPSFDDEAWYGLAYARIYEITGNSSFLDVAFDIYNWTYKLGWDNTSQCHGGFWFDGRYSKKITITNAQMLLLMSKLYRLDPKRDPTLPSRIQKTWDYIVNNKIINYTTHLVADEIEIYDNCSVIPKYNLTYNEGLVIGALVEMYKMSKDQGKLELAINIAEGARKYLTKENILTEYCDPGNSCKNDLDAKMFKGIFMRNLRYLLDVANSTIFEEYYQWIVLNAEYAYNQTRCLETIDKCHLVFLDGPSNKPHIGPVFGTNWRGPFDAGRPIQQTSMLDLLISAIPQDTKCQGDGCTYNPVTPPIIHIDCQTHPCPTNYTCCTWDKTYHTCCTPGQECYDGGCY